MSQRTTFMARTSLLEASISDQLALIVFMMMVIYVTVNVVGNVIDVCSVLSDLF